MGRRRVGGWGEGGVWCQNLGGLLSYMTQVTHSDLPSPYIHTPPSLPPTIIDPESVLDARVIHAFGVPSFPPSLLPTHPRTHPSQPPTHAPTHAPEEHA